ncbi:hypothetical protein ACFWPU_00945 [Streptomyces sp. NPDC058471]|uniref:hypothetical protein n=1 Tax=Streptomyces sp. NPDC058471 TaxID=3346516 RepID=UPI003668C015
MSDNDTMMYSVVWRTQEDPGEHRRKDVCRIERGYSEFGDIPKMLAIKHAVPIDHIEILSAILITEALPTWKGFTR